MDIDFRSPLEREESRKPWKKPLRILGNFIASKLNVLAVLKKNPVYTLLGVLVLIFAASASIFYFKYQDTLSISKKILGSSSTNVLEASDVVKKVGKLTELPDETPTVATITDLTKLSDQAFFAKAQNGDKVLVYTQAKRAILYRPSTNKIIEIGPVSIPTPTKAVTPKPSVIRIDSVSPTSSTPNVIFQAISPTPTQNPTVSPTTTPAESQ